MVRVRPVLPQDLKAYEGSKEAFEEIEKTIQIKNKSQIQFGEGVKAKIYSFDTVFGKDSTQPEVYEDVEGLINSFLMGQDVCIFAYGQTGSGKTFTMGTEFSKQSSDSSMGIIPRAIRHIMKQAKEKSLQLEEAKTEDSTSETEKIGLSQVRVCF